MNRQIVLCLAFLSLSLLAPPPTQAQPLVGFIWIEHTCAIHWYLEFWVQDTTVIHDCSASLAGSNGCRSLYERNGDTVGVNIEHFSSLAYAEIGCPGAGQQFHCQSTHSSGNHARADISGDTRQLTCCGQTVQCNLSGSVALPTGTFTSTAGGGTSSCTFHPGLYTDQ